MPCVRACSRLAVYAARNGSALGKRRRWSIQIEIDGAFYTERDYADAASASHAIAGILRQHAERAADLDEDACEECEEALDLMTCSQCGADAFVRTCDHGGPRPIRVVESAAYCCNCRP